MSVSLAAAPTRVRRPRTRIAAEPVAEQLLWLDPAELRKFGVHTGGNGEEDPERVETNMVIRHSIRHNGFDPAQPPLLMLDRAAGIAVLKDGTHRTNFAADAGVPLIPVRVRFERISPRFTHFPYAGQFDHAAPVI